jgi:hypothetical protein
MQCLQNEIMKSHIVFALLSLLFAGCSTYQTTLKQNGGYKIYAIEEQEIFQLVYQEMALIVDSETVNETDGPERGFYVQLTLGNGWYNVFVKIVPVEGIDLRGANVKGYFVELGGEGNYLTPRPKKMIDEIQKNWKNRGRV